MRKIRRTTGLAILLCSLGIFAWAIWPTTKEERITYLPEGLIRTLGDNPASEEGKFLLRMAWPTRMQVGSTADIDVNLSIEDDSTVPTLEDRGILAPVGVIEARLEFLGVQFAPNGVINQGFTESTPLAIQWQVRPVSRGNYQGVVWLHYITNSEDSQGLASRQLISAQPVEVHAISLFGLNSYSAQLAAMAGIFLGVILSLDMFVDCYSIMRNWRRETR